MSALSTTNGETAREMLKRALVAKGTADWNGRQEPEYREFACRNYVHTAELALKAVYVKHEQPFERTPNIAELYENCPDLSRSSLLGLADAALRTFSSWYLSSYSSKGGPRCRTWQTVRESRAGSSGGRRMSSTVGSDTILESAQKNSVRYKLTCLNKLVPIRRAGVDRDVLTCFVASPFRSPNRTNDWADCPLPTRPPTFGRTSGMRRPITPPLSKATPSSSNR